jgi:outer membrane protein TolC
VRREAAQAAFGVRLTPTLTSGIESLGLFRQTVGLGVAKRLTTGGEVVAEASSFRFDDALGNRRDVGFSVRLSQPLMSGFGVVARAETEMAARAVDSARRGVELARHQLIVAVAEAFFAVMRQTRVLEASRRSLSRAATLREATQARARAGLATELDTMRARLLESHAAAALGRNQEALDAARDQLRHVLGRGLDAVIEIEEAIPASLQPGAPLDVAQVEALVGEALARRPELDEANARIETARRAADVARWQLLPPLNVDVGYTRRAAWMAGGLLVRDFDGGWFVGISSGAGLGFRASRAALQTASLSVAAAERQAREAGLRTAMETRAAARAVSRTAEAIVLADDAVEMAQRQRELVEIRFERGLATSLDLVEAETMLYETETAAIAARLDHALARLSLDRATGSLDPSRWTP